MLTPMNENKILPAVKLSNTTSISNEFTPPHCILVAEDDHDVRRLNTELLTDSGYRVDGAEDGAVAWETLQIKRYHLLITDYDMPKMSGIELVKKVRGARMELPIIMVSGTMPTEELKEHGLHIDATLPKPYAIAEFLKTVKEVLSTTVSRPDFNLP
jgi:DNA-binding response OmpR family regulator